MRRLTLKIDASLAGRKVGNLLRRELGLSASMVSRIKYRESGILVDGVRVFTDRIVKEGELLSAEIGDLPAEDSIEPVNLPLSVLYEDEDLLVIDKPAPLAVHPSLFLGEEPTVAGACKSRYGREFVFHPVNRLDRGTTGLMLIAKNAYMHERMRRILHTGQFERGYLAVSEKTPVPPHGRIDLPIARSNESILSRTVAEGGAPSCTDYRTLYREGKYSLIAVRPLTGRTHQIRVHLSSIGCPLLGDWLYGEEGDFGRPALHSACLRFIHPLSGEVIELYSPLPQDMRSLGFSVEKSIPFWDLFETPESAKGQSSWI